MSGGRAGTNGWTLPWHLISVAHGQSSQCGSESGRWVLWVNKGWGKAVSDMMGPFAYAWNFPRWGGAASHCPTVPGAWAFMNALHQASKLRTNCPQPATPGGALWSGQPGTALSQTSSTARGLHRPCCFSLLLTVGFLGPIQPPTSPQPRAGHPCGDPNRLLEQS